MLDDLEKVAKDTQRLNAKAYHQGELAERKEVLKELKRIAGFPEMGARVQLQDYIKHLEEQE